MSSENTKQPKPAPKEVVFYSYPKLIFVWPIIAMGFIFYLFTGTDALGGAWHEFVAWTYMSVSIIVLLTLGIDLERNYSVFWVAVICALIFLGMYMADHLKIKFFGDVYRYFDDLNIRFTDAKITDSVDATKTTTIAGMRTYALVLSIFLSIPYIAMLIWTRIQHKWRITHNEFEHYSFGRSDDSLARGAKRVRSTYPDIFELLICGAGTLIVYSATGRTELRRIKHVPMLYFLRKKINRLLETTSVTTDQQHQDTLVEEEVEAETSEESSSSNEAKSGDDDMGGPAIGGSNDPL